MCGGVGAVIVPPCSQVQFATTKSAKFALYVSKKMLMVGEHLSSIFTAFPCAGSPPFLARVHRLSLREFTAFPVPKLARRAQVIDEKKVTCEPCPPAAAPSSGGGTCPANIPPVPPPPPPVAASSCHVFRYCCRQGAEGYPGVSLLAFLSGVLIGNVRGRPGDSRSDSSNKRSRNR